jgi:ATP-dependent DNA helicase RecQ
MEIREVLKKYWGYEHFRPLQEEIIQSVLDGKDTIALLPTGGGKSICYQVPALARTGLCVVISPLIALMKDQVETLKKKGIDAVAVHSGLMKAEIEMHLDNCTFGKTKFLYISPERLEKKGMAERLSRMKINLLAVDEAHCISQWGYDFRPPYLRIAAIREFLPGVPVMALTATATNKVIIDIQEKLAFKTPNEIKGSFRRNNLTFFAFNEEDKRGRLLKIIRKVKGCGVIYTRNRKNTQEIAKYLDDNGIPSTYYHAGLSPQIRSKHQDFWMNGTKPVIVSTNAFGMGIDKPDVRFVVHMDLPESLEAYYQEAGRAGRDGKPAFCIILYDNGDLKNLEQQHENNFPEPDLIRKVYYALGNYCNIPEGSGEDFSVQFDLYAFAKTYKFSPIVVFSVLSFLAREAQIAYTDQLAETSRLHFLQNREDLYRFQVQHVFFDPFIKTLLRSYSGLFTDYVRIQEKDLAKRTGLTEDQVIGYLKQLEQLSIVSYAMRKTQPGLIWLKDRINPKHLLIDRQNYINLKENAKTRYLSVWDYVEAGQQCRVKILLSYFDEFDVPACGKCDVCIKLNKEELQRADFERLKSDIIHLISQKECAIPELIAQLSFGDEKKVFGVVNWLIDNSVIYLDENQMLKLHGK